jgi:hypothetical protein
MPPLPLPSSLPLVGSITFANYAANGHRAGPPRPETTSQTHPTHLNATTGLADQRGSSTPPDAPREFAQSVLIEKFVVKLQPGIPNSVCVPTGTAVPERINMSSNEQCGEVEFLSPGVNNSAAGSYRLANKPKLLIMRP